MNVPLEPLKRFRCTLPGCYNSFNTEKEMKYHKVNDPTHFYCKKCDVDCEDWKALTQHKVEAMRPWVENSAHERPEGSPKHIVCEFCGEDFKSLGGRILHRETRHQAEQSIPCPGCREVFFTRAADLIGHLEKNKCETIRSYEFRAKIQHKYIKKEIMKDPGQFMENIQTNDTFVPPPEKPGLNKGKEPVDTTDTETDGGVLLDQEDEEQKRGEKPLEARMASIDLGGKKVPLRRENCETWPFLPGMKEPKVPINVKNQSIGSPPPSVVGSELSASQFASQVTSRRGGIKVSTEPCPSLSSQASTSDLGPTSATSFSVDDDDNKSTTSTAKAENVLERGPAWATTNTSRKLFGNVEPNAHSAETKSILKKHQEEAEKAPNLLLNSRWWDPFSDEFNLEMFKNQVIGSYRCPFPGCDGENFDTPFDIETHMMLSHTRTQFRCPGCLKLFKSACGMVGHMESTLKCTIKKSKNFKSVLDEITGGFIKAKRLPQPAIYRSDTAVVKADQVVGGVMSIMYKPCKSPEGHEDILQEVTEE